jgi:PKD repeat protein
MKRLGRAVLAGTLAAAIAGLGLPWGAQFAYAAEAPVLTSVWLEADGVATSTLDEAQTFLVRGAFTDGDLDDSHFALIRIGSRLVESTTGIPGGDRTFAISKFYPDDSPTGTAQDPFTLTVQIRDGAGLVSNIWTMAVTVRNVAPTVATLGLTPASALENETVQASGTFADPGTKDTFTLTLDWGDGSSAFTRSYLSTDPKTFSATHAYAIAGSYAVTATVTDDDTGRGTAAAALAVGAPNTPPSGLVLSAASVVEGDQATLRGDFIDPDAADAHAVLVQWGDGSTGGLDLSAGALSFTATHAYASSGTYTITATVSDSGSATAQSSLPLAVSRRNHAPVDLALTTTGAVEGAPGSVQLTFTDPDPLDGHRVLVTWGDASSTEHRLDAGTFALEVAHVFASAGTYTVTVQVTDAYGAAVSGTASFAVSARTRAQVVVELASLVIGWNLDAGAQNGLLSKIREEQDELGSGRGNVCNSLGALANHVNAQTGKKISPEQATAFWSALAGATITDCGKLQKAQSKTETRPATELPATTGPTDTKAEKKAAKEEKKAAKEENKAAKEENKAAKETAKSEKD